MTNYEINISRSIKAIRADNSLTQSEFANKLGTTKSAVSHWENGTNLPDTRMLIKISIVFGVPMSQLFGEN